MIRTFASTLVLLLSCSSGENAPAPDENAAPAPTPLATSSHTVATSPPPSASGSAVALASASTPPSAPIPPSADASAPVATPAPASAAPASPPADASRLTLKGKVIQGAVVFAKVDGKVSKIDFLGHRTQVSEDGRFPIAFFRNAPKTEKMTIHFADGTSLEHVFSVEQRTYEPDDIKGLPPHMVKLEGDAQRKHDAAEARIQAVRMKYGTTACYEDGFQWPVVGKITSRYGQPRTLNGIDGGIHWGVDIVAPVGAPVKAPACGTVVFTEADIPLSGSTLVLDHGHGLTSTFIHLSGFTKKVGDVVKQGEIIAKTGQTGRATGPHLDWRMNYFEIRVDPELLAPPMPAK